MLAQLFYRSRDYLLLHRLQLAIATTSLLTSQKTSIKVKNISKYYILKAFTYVCI